jgi:hypothetical protein
MSGYDGQGKSQAEEIHGAMVAVVIGLAAGIAFWVLLGIIVWQAFGA